MTPDLTIASEALAALIAHAREAAPRECCGLLIGSGAHIETVHRSNNLETGATRYLIDPRAHFEAIHAARASGRALLGVYHSHPSGTAIPSASDLEEASYPEYVYVIVGLLTGDADVRAFRIEAGTFTEQRVIFRSSGADVV